MQDSKNIAFVPDDVLLPCRHIFRPVPGGEAERLFSICHKVSEGLYAGGGLWVESAEKPYPPETRQVSRRVIGYLGAYGKTGRPEYGRRAREGLSFLLAEQKDSGEFVWYRNSVAAVRNDSDCLYETGIAGVAFLYGYAAFGDEALLTASEKAARWEMGCPVNGNYNYNMFAVWHLARHFLCTRDVRFLECALEKSESTLRDQLPNGRWPGHNSWIWYHGIILRGLAELYGALPDGCRDKQSVLRCIVRAVNRLVVDQREDGSIPPNPDVSEHALHDPVVNAHRNAFVLHALCSVRRSTRLDVGNLINGVMRYRLRTEIGEAQAEAASRFHIVPGGWKDRLLRSAGQAPKAEAALALPHEKTVWTETFGRFSPHGKWGQLPEGWFVCWFPGREPGPGVIRVGESGAGGLEFSVRDGGICGIGCNLSERGMKLIQGHRYRLCCRIKPIASPAANNALSIVLSAYSGGPRSEWDMFTGCDVAVCNAAEDGFFDFVLWFIAKGEQNCVYLSMGVGEHETALAVVHVNLADEGEAYGPPGPELPYRDYDCSIMALGEYLRTCIE